MKAYGGLDGYIYVFLTSALVVSGQLHAPAALATGKGPRSPLDRRLGGPQSRFGRREEEKILYPAGTAYPIRW
jgi:hypothetical protein